MRLHYLSYNDLRMHGDNNKGIQLFIERREFHKDVKYGNLFRIRMAVTDNKQQQLQHLFN